MNLRRKFRPLGVLAYTASFCVAILAGNLAFAASAPALHDHSAHAHGVDSELHSSGQKIGHGKEWYRSPEFGQLVATSDAVVEATVVDVRPGTVVEEAPGEIEGRVEFNDVFLRIDAVDYLRARLTVEQGDTVIMSEISTSSGQPIELNHVKPSIVGDRGFYFLTLIEAKTLEDASYLTFTLVSSQGRYRIQPDNSLEGSNPDDAVVQEVQTLTPDQLRGEIEKAEKDIQAGKTLPMSPIILCPPPDCSDTDTPSVHVEISVEDTGVQMVFQCTATSLNELAIRTEISECYLEDRSKGFRNSAPPASTDNNTAATVGTETGLQGGEDRYRNDSTYLCYTAMALFADGSTNEDAECRPRSANWASG